MTPDEGRALVEKSGLSLLLITERGGESVILINLTLCSSLITSAASKQVSIHNHESRNKINTHNTMILTWKTL